MITSILHPISFILRAAVFSRLAMSNPEDTEWFSENENDVIHVQNYGLHTQSHDLSVKHLWEISDCCAGQPSLPPSPKHQMKEYLFEEWSYIPPVLFSSFPCLSSVCLWAWLSNSSHLVHSAPVLTASAHLFLISSSSCGVESPVLQSLVTRSLSTSTCIRY